MSNDEIITGTITETESGESWNVEFKPFLTDNALTAIIKVEDIEIITASDATQVCVECKALDSIGFVYNLGMEFMPETDERKEKIISDMKAGAIFLVKGRYCISLSEMVINMINPEYLPLPREMDEQEVQEVFKVNSSPLANIQ